MEPEIITTDHKLAGLLFKLIAIATDNNGCDHGFDNFNEACNQIESGLVIKIDREGTIEYMKSKGGWCDCEIMMNVSSR